MRTRIEGVDISETSSSASLKELLAKNPYVDVILLDFRMPDSIGFSVLVELRTRVPEVPVVVVSATEYDEAVDRASPGSLSSSTC